MWGGEEPSTCVYTTWMSTPAACREEDRTKELAQLQQLEQFEAEVRAEIEAAEKAAAVAHDEL
ncbi:uncharacterized protein HaLaN_06036 [Haematococcus lacustris]|uniref:Uncharacterized protein n=1 Tax=Haematococcus lacustris TaxID=44745 RepID=A0A699YKB8_HAELA|nr:uncharacterized protein HaLaN_06036 [Haematococcus lacustris]